MRYKNYNIKNMLSKSTITFARATNFTPQRLDKNKAKRDLRTC